MKLSKKWLIKINGKEYLENMTMSYIMDILWRDIVERLRKNCRSYITGVNSNKDSFTERDVVSQLFPTWWIQIVQWILYSFFATPFEWPFDTTNLGLAKDHHLTHLWYMSTFTIPSDESSTIFTRSMMKFVFIHLEIRAAQLGLI